MEKRIKIPELLQRKLVDYQKTLIMTQRIMSDLVEVFADLKELKGGHLALSQDMSELVVEDGQES